MKIITTNIGEKREVEWKDGEGILFDESYKHFVKNETNYNRIILFIDVKRPLHTGFMTLINDGIVWIIKNSPYNY